MGSRDIVHQLTEEMGMNQQMLQNMQPGQMQLPSQSHPVLTVDEADPNAR